MAAKNKTAAPSRLHSLLPDRKTGLLLLGAIALMLGVYFAFTARMQAEEKAMQAEVAATEDLLAVAEQQLAGLQSGATNPAAEAAEAARYDALLPTAVDAAALAAALPTDADGTYGVTVTQMDPGEITEGPTGTLKYQPFQMSATGQTANLAAWLQSVQQNPALLTVDNVTYASAAAGSSSSSNAGAADLGATAGETTLTFTLKAWFSTTAPLSTN